MLASFLISQNVNVSGLSKGSNTLHSLPGHQVIGSLFANKVQAFNTIQLSYQLDVGGL